MPRRRRIEALCVEGLGISEFTECLDVVINCGHCHRQGTPPTRHHVTSSCLVIMSRLVIMPRHHVMSRHHATSSCLVCHVPNHQVGRDRRRPPRAFASRADTGLPHLRNHIDDGLDRGWTSLPSSVWIHALLHRRTSGRGGCGEPTFAGSGGGTLSRAVVANGRRAGCCARGAGGSSGNRCMVVSPPTTGRVEAVRCYWRWLLHPGRGQGIKHRQLHWPLEMVTLPGPARNPGSTLL